MTVVRAYSSKGKGALLKTPEFQGTPQESYSFFSGVNTKEKQTSPREAKIHSQLDQDSLHAMSPSARKKKKKFKAVKKLASFRVFMVFTNNIRKFMKAPGMPIKR